MSTRVEKGGPKFRPILKSKTRPSATPAPQDARGRQSVEPAASMPPPSAIPERANSMTPQPQVPNVRTPTPVPSLVVASGRAGPTPIQVSRATPHPGNVITVPVSRALSQPVKIIPARASQPPQTSSIAFSSGSSAVTSSSIAIPVPSRETSALPLLEPGFSRGTPISVSRSTVTPAPLSSKGKKRAEPEPETSSADDPNPTEHGRVAQKRPKLSILQAEADRVKKKPSRRVKSKKAIVDSDTEGEVEINGRETSETECSIKQVRSTKKKKPAAEAEFTPDESQPKRTLLKRKAKERENLTIEASDNQDLSDVTSESSPAPKKRRRRAAAGENTEPQGTPEPMDPTQTTMSAICDDLGSGRMSSRWESSQLLYAEARKRAREDQARAIAEAEELERETGRATGKKTASKPILPGERNSDTEGGGETVEGGEGQNPDEFSYTESLKASHYAPQVRIGANGEVVLDVDSLQVDRAADPDLVEEYSHIEENDQSRFTNSSSWGKRRVVRWGKEDTALFYDALRQFGQNFDLIARVIPGRTYRMCKNKFKAEDKKNPALIDEALKNGVAVDLSTLSRMTGKDFSGPTPIIIARKILTLAEDGTPSHVTQENDTAEQVEDGLTVESSMPVALLENANDDEISNNQPAVRQPASPPPPEPPLDNITRQSASPPPPESLLMTDNSATKVKAPSGPIAIGPPKRTIAVPTREVLQKPTQERLLAFLGSSPPAVASAGKKTITVKKSKRKKGLQEEGVEVLGLVDDHTQD